MEYDENPINTLYNISKKIKKTENNFQMPKTQKTPTNSKNDEIPKKLVKDSKWSTTYKSCFLETAKQITNSSLNSQKLQTLSLSLKKKNFQKHSKNYQKKKKKIFENYGKNFKNTILYTREQLLNDPDAELLRGTSKLTNHIPGYSGHIPYNSHNGKIRKQIFDAEKRSFLSKENILEN